MQDRLHSSCPADLGQGQFYVLWNLQWGAINTSYFLMHHAANTENCCAAAKSYSPVLAVVVRRGRQFLAKMRVAMVLL